MKAVKFILAIAISTAMLTACDQKRDKASLGGSSDSVNVGAAPDTSHAAADSARIKDSTSEGNVSPTGRPNN